MAERGVTVAINSDADERARRLYQEAAKTMHYGGASEEEALRMITLNAARQLGVDKSTGSIDVGKDADLAIFSGHPFAPAWRVEMTLIDGRVFFDRNTAPTLENMIEQLKRRPRSIHQWRCAVKPPDARDARWRVSGSPRRSRRRRCRRCRRRRRRP